MFQSKISKKVIKFNESSKRTDSLKRNFKIITFQSENYCFAKSVIYEKENGYNDSIGTSYNGDIIKMKVEPYEFKDPVFGNSIKTENFKSVVFGDTTNIKFENEIEKVFTIKGHKIVKNKNGIISL